jgi:hypothetical protein
LIVRQHKNQHHDASRLGTKTDSGDLIHYTEA